MSNIENFSEADSTSKNHNLSFFIMNSSSVPILPPMYKFIDKHNKLYYVPPARGVHKDMSLFVNVVYSGLVKEYQLDQAVLDLINPQLRHLLEIKLDYLNKLRYAFTCLIHDPPFTNFEVLQVFCIFLIVSFRYFGFGTIWSKVYKDIDVSIGRIMIETACWCKCPYDFDFHPDINRSLPYDKISKEDMTEFLEW